MEAMYNEGAPEFFIDQGLYYQTAPNYPYYCTGFESPGKLDDHHRIFAVDGQDLQYAAAQTESSPYVYYTPNYGYEQSPYNPYNPCIPGAMIGVDGQFAGTHQYYTIPPYPSTVPVSSSGYYPLVVQSGPEIIPNSLPEPMFDNGAYSTYIPNGRGLKPSLSSASAAFTMPTPRPVSNQVHSLARISEAPRANVGSSKQGYGSALPGSLLSPASSNIFQDKDASGSGQPLSGISNERIHSHHNQYNVGVSDFGSNAHKWVSVDNNRPKYNQARAINDVNGSTDLSNEQNRGPRTNKLKNNLALKPITTSDGDSSNLHIIYPDQYNKDDFPVDYVSAMFFVIKSYSEDDVHKSVKYNVWSSTPNGNKKLNYAYEESQRICSKESRGCRIFLFFSVNASGQFCGVAEMVGPVEFDNDMDFWQQDKWSGSFPVVWHIIKDVPNTNFRHIILENNENKPVTNSRDTQEIRFKQGMEMLKIFKNYTSKTSLLDDFLYYENRQKIMQEEKSKLLLRNYPSFMPVLDPPRKVNYAVDPRASVNEKITEVPSKNERAATTSSSKENTKDEAKAKAKDDISSTLNIGSISISPKQSGVKEVETEPCDNNIITVGSMHIKLNGFKDSSSSSSSSSLLKIRNFPHVPSKAQQQQVYHVKEEGGGSVKNGEHVKS